jgi:hypothetical protein
MIFFSFGCCSYVNWGILYHAVALLEAGIGSTVAVDVTVFLISSLSLCAM